MLLSAPLRSLSPVPTNDTSTAMLIFHGNRDQTVPIEQSEKYYAALKAAGKAVKYVEIEDYGHGDSLSPAQQAKVLGIIEDYLAKDCGPGGL